MKKLLILTAALALAACSSTWSGVKEDTSHNMSRTKEAVKEGGNAVGRGITHVGEKIENATE
ncbi:hypothetical protein NELON_03935 [Neisseria elongata subsp. glycolytica ATCC 29315]|jgi:hypothetical protein|uniref:Lipoprotein n=1 Tax=Neisseria elongata subsp. glycolytica ATCC 29315 TaxID=546263 RepID=A0A0B5CL71_NEIEG|nr:hypothetical protein [Neisseria elongata]AJE18119.1 hypothetical protein NELON_03935 [Neisseria elongata subsp. glycolytica ATCC 29315]SQH49974.1 lipoprotein [Neisseria elongata subsp. glycolytica]